MPTIRGSVKQSSVIKARVGQQNVSRVLSNASSPPTRLIDLTDVNNQLKDKDGMILVWNLPTQTFIMTSVIDADTLSIGSSVFYTDTTDNILGDANTGAVQTDGGVGIGKNLTVGSSFSVAGTIDNTLGNAHTGAVQIDGGVGIAKNLSIGSSLSVKKSLFYDSENFYSPNGVAYFDSSGKLVSGLSTESPISTSNYILTTLEIAGIGTPVWTSTIDGGEY